MTILLNNAAAHEAEKYLLQAGEEAKHAMCAHRKCGSVVVKDGEIIGVGYNAPPLDSEANRTCHEEFRSPTTNRFDRTCCVHAEWRAILDALRRNPDKIEGARLYFADLDENGDTGRVAGKLKCTTCSRLILDSGIAEVVLWLADGPALYDSSEYNRLSYDYLRKLEVEAKVAYNQLKS